MIKKKLLSIVLITLLSFTFSNNSTDEVIKKLENYTDLVFPIITNFKQTNLIIQ